eukprot:2487866-Rhodomonas_salina.1
MAGLKAYRWHVHVVTGSRVDCVVGTGGVVLLSETIRYDITGRHSLRAWPYVMLVPGAAHSLMSGLTINVTSRGPCT